MLNHDRLTQTQNPSRHKSEQPDLCLLNYTHQEQDLITEDFVRDVWECIVFSNLRYESQENSREPMTYKPMEQLQVQEKGIQWQ